MPAAIQLTDERMQVAIAMAGGNVALAARLLGVSRRTLARRLAKNPALMDDPEEIRRDQAMAAALAAIGRGDVKMVRWYLSRYGHERGFGPRRTKVERMTPEALKAFLADLKRSSRKSASFAETDAPAAAPSRRQSNHRGSRAAPFEPE